MNKYEKIAATAAIALAMVSGSYAYGQSANNVVSNEQTIFACVTGVNGNITKVSNAPKTCPRGTSPISWNMVGPKGEQGPKGNDGVDGQTPPSTSLRIFDSQGDTGAVVVNLDLDGNGVIFVDGKVYGITYAGENVYLKGGVDLEIAINDINPLAPSGTYDILFKELDCSGVPYFYFGGEGKKLRLTYSQGSTFRNYELIDGFIGEILLEGESTPLSQMKARYWWDNQFSDQDAVCRPFPFAHRTENVYPLSVLETTEGESRLFEGDLRMGLH